MTKIRVLLLTLTILVVATLGTLVALYARGYRLDSDTLTFEPNGLFVIKSDPDGAQVFVNGELETATNSTVPITPGTYDIRIQKEGYISWNKRMLIEEEIVTEATAHLFKRTPSLSALTFSSIINPTPSYGYTKIAYVVPPDTNGNSSVKGNEGLWIMEFLNLPLGFSRDPRQITDGNLTDGTFEWSPDGREILLTTKTGVYLLNTSGFVTQAQRVNITKTFEEVTEKWEVEKIKKLRSQITNVPEELQDILTRKASAVVFSPDNDMVLYIASGSATLKDNLIPQLPGSSTQKQERDIKTNHAYIYDIKEDRNFVVDEDATKLITQGGNISNRNRRLTWFPTSRHLMLAEEDNIIIMDYDGTNRQTVYSGSYEAPNAFPALSTNRLIILTNLGANSSAPNLFSLSIK